MITTFRRINSWFDIYLISENEPVFTDKEIVYSVPEGKLYYQNGLLDDLNIIKYGLHSHDQWWSSRASVINGVFGLDTIEIAYKAQKSQYSSYFAGCAMFIKDLKLPDNLKLEIEDRENEKAYHIRLKPDIEFPRGKDYFRSTVLDINGNLIYPQTTNNDKS